MKFRSLAGFLLIAIFAIMVQSCGSDPAATEDLAQMYNNAITNAQVVTNAKISKDLTAITADEPDLVWEGTPGASSLLVITNMSKTAYENYGYKTAYETGADYTLSQSALAWVTVVPEAINYFKDLSYIAPMVTELRYAQALGLSQPTSDRMIVGLQVNINDLFRPCPDMEVNDHECELDFSTDHAGGFIAIDGGTLIYESSACSATGCTYDTWFENRRATVYTGSGAFPFTQLGYTYDWASDAPAMNIGLSEFAVKGGSTFRVVSAATTTDYFINNWGLY